MIDDQDGAILAARFVPQDLAETSDEHREYLNKLNEQLLLQLQQAGDVFISNAIVDDDYLLRACIVNFRTTPDIIARVPDWVAETGHRVDIALRR